MQHGRPCTPSVHRIQKWHVPLPKKRMTGWLVLLGGTWKYRYKLLNWLDIYLEPICPLFCLQNKVFSNQNKGHLGSRYIYIYMI